MKSALITGVNGMDGSHLADFLLDNCGINFEFAVEKARNISPELLPPGDPPLAIPRAALFAILRN